MKLFMNINPYVSILDCLDHCVMAIIKDKGDKFAPRNRQYVFIGYPYGEKGWQLSDLET